MGQKTEKAQRREMRQQAKEEVKIILPMIEEQTLARILIMPAPGRKVLGLRLAIPGAIWRRIKAYQLEYYKKVYGTRIERRDKPQAAQAPEPTPEQILANVEYPCPKHSVDHLDNDNICRAQDGDKKCGWNPKEDKPKCPEHGPDYVNKYGVCERVVDIKFHDHKKVERRCHWFLGRPEKV